MSVQNTNMRITNEICHKFSNYENFFTDLNRFSYLFGRMEFEKIFLLLIYINYLYYLY